MRLSDLKPQFARAYCNWATGYVGKSDYEKALADFEAGISKDLKLPLCYFARGDMYFKKGDYQKAVDDFNEVVRLKPSDPISLYKRGEAYEHLSAS